jgi:hypothetical protein
VVGSRHAAVAEREHPVAFGEGAPSDAQRGGVIQLTGRDSDGACELVEIVDFVAVGGEHERVDHSVLACGDVPVLDDRAHLFISSGAWDESAVALIRRGPCAHVAVA